MRIKTFEAPTMQEALTLARMELGDNAVVLNTKHTKPNGLLGFRGQGKVELMAAVDDSPVAQQQTPAVAPKPATPVSWASQVYAESYAATPAASPVAVMTSPASDQDEIVRLRSELGELSRIVRQLLEPQQSPVSAVGAAVKSEKSLIARLGIDEDMVRGILPELLGIENPAVLASTLAARMQAFAQPPVIDSRQIIAVVGPTGVGKTTTLAKLAARFALEQGKSVAMITADTYRIGAVEQLRTYARIMGVPLETAMSPEEVAAGLAKHADKDVVLIDTVGRSQRNNEHLSEIKNLVDAARPTQTHLVVAATIADDIQKEIICRFSVFSPTHLVVTKLDESLTRGCLVNLPLAAGLPLSCTTSGQNVPKDIDFAEAGHIARLVTEVA